MNTVLLPLFERYRALLSAHGTTFSQYDKCTAEHLIHLCDLAVQGINNGTMAYGKLCRWLGFIQGVLCASGLVLVDDERDFTRPFFKDEV